MRSTRASAAISRLNLRAPGNHYTMSSSSNHLFTLIRQDDQGEEAIGEPLPLDQFVTFVNSLGPQEVRRVTRNDAAFEKQLVRKPAG
jgi:hypothetical protein